MHLPSVFTIRNALQRIEGAIRHQPLSEDSATGRDLGTPVFDFGGDQGLRVLAATDLVDEDDEPADFEQPTVIFEVPPRLTDAEVVEALGDGAGELSRLVQVKGTDALGWYLTFHQRAAQHGIFLPIEGVAHLAVTALQGLELPLERRLEIAFQAILRHELFHFEVDCMAANWELTIGKEIYWWVADAHRDLPGYKDLEEALANAYMLRGFRHPGGALRHAKGSYEAIKAFCELQPPGYREGPKYARSRRHYIDGCRTLSANWFYSQVIYVNDWEIPTEALDILIFYPNPFKIDWRRCPVLVHDRLGLLTAIGIGVDFFETIANVVETPAFRRALCKLGSRAEALWERRKNDLARSVALRGLGFEKWPPGGTDCYSVRLDGNYRVHLRRSRPEGSWIAEDVGDHKAMGHGG